MKNNCSDYAIFHWLLPFSEKEYIVQCTYNNIPQITFLRYAQIIFPTLLLFYHWQHRISLQTKFPRMYVQIIFCTLLFDAKNIMHDKKTIYNYYEIYRVVDSERCNWLKNNYHKMIW